LRGGLEAANKIMMPGLFVSLLLLVAYAHIEGDAARAWVFLFWPDFSALSGEGLLMALGQALASVSVGTGALLTYGSYVSKNVNLVSSSWTIVLGDSAVAILAGLAIFPIVFASGLDPASGPGLMFLSLPIALGNLPGGYVFSIIFFVLVFFAAFTSSLSMLEPSVAWLVEKGYRRPLAAAGVGAIVWLLATGSVLSFNVLRDFTPLSFLPGYEGKNIFEILEYTFANLSLPLTALLLALFAGWILGRNTLLEEIGLTGKAAVCWRLAVRFLAPLALVLTLSLGLMS
jgi:NSS family neurotransmitter:Na+ symporter